MVFVMQNQVSFLPGAPLSREAPGTKQWKVREPFHTHLLIRIMCTTFQTECVHVEAQRKIKTYSLATSLAREVGLTL